MVQKELKQVPGLKEEDLVIIKKFTYGEKSKLTSKCFDLDMRKKKVNMDLGQYKIMILKYGVVSAPFFDIHTLREVSIENLDPDTGEFLFNEVLKFNGMRDSEDQEDLAKKSSS